VKRFWKDVEVAMEEGAWRVLLDGRPLRTPARAFLSVPVEALASAIADEWRNVGALVRLGWRDRALRLARQLLGDRRPAAWNQWGEVVWRDERINRFIGDMPHTWVASDFIRSALDLFAYERERDSSLVLLAGVPAEWLQGEGLSIGGLRTASGELAFTARASGEKLTVRIPAGLRMPAGGIVIQPPRGQEVRVRRVPATVEIRY
jgi:hypothetical protein